MKCNETLLPLRLLYQYNNLAVIDINAEWEMGQDILTKKISQVL